MRIAFTLIGPKEWTGGYNYLLNLLNLLALYKKDQVTPVLFVGSSVAQQDLAEFLAVPGLELVRTEGLDPARRTCALLRAALTGRDAVMADIFKAHQIDVVFEVAKFFGWRLGVPAIAWMTDFQHLAMPEQFSKAAWFKRDLGFRAQIWSGRAVMLSSDDARRTCEASYPGSRGHTRTVHFSVKQGPDVSFEEARRVADSYGLPEHFIFMPNQFWRHKNHRLVLQALEILRERGQPMVIAAAGKQQDLRDANYFPAFDAEWKAKGLQDSLRLLGLIPYQHLAMLLRASSALLNPSLFEGWSTTVEEARSMGVPMILSNLAVHQEQMGADARYFDRHSAEALADALQGFVPLGLQQREQMAVDARQKAQLRAQDFVEAFHALAVECHASQQRA